MSVGYWSIPSDKSNIRATYNQLERHRLPLISFPLGFLFSLGNKKSEQFQGPASSQWGGLGRPMPYPYMGARHTLIGRGRCNQGRQSTTSLCELCVSRLAVLPFVAVSLGRLALALIVCARGPRRAHTTKMYNANCLQSIVVNCRRKESMLRCPGREKYECLHERPESGWAVCGLHNCNVDNDSVTIAV